MTKMSAGNFEEVIHSKCLTINDIFPICLMLSDHGCKLLITLNSEQTRFELEINEESFNNYPF